MFIRVNGTETIYPFELAQLRIENPSTSFPRDFAQNPTLLAEYGVYPVLQAAYVEHDRFHKAVEVDPILVDGEYLQMFEIVPLTEEELDAATAEKGQDVRDNRNRMLFACDWTQGRDIDEATSAAWAVYRQALRDITTQPGFPWGVVWPVEPA